MSKLKVKSVVDTRKAPYAVTYTFPAVDFGAGDSFEIVEAALGKRGVVRDITLYDCTENFSSTTTGAFVRVGTLSDNDKYAGTKAAEFDSLTVGDSKSANFDKGDVIAKPANDGEDVKFRVTSVAPTGGTPTGIATVAVTVLWYD